VIVTKDTNGYQRVFVGRSHALADAAGYVRLHVLVAAADGLDVRSGHVHHRRQGFPRRSPRRLAASSV